MSLLDANSSDESFITIELAEEMKVALRNLYLLVCGTTMFDGGSTRICLYHLCFDLVLVLEQTFGAIEKSLSYLWLQLVERSPRVVSAQSLDLKCVPMTTSRIVSVTGLERGLEIFI